MGQVISRLTKLLLLLWIAGTSLSMAQQNASEAQVKAAFIYNFAKFITWPISSFAESSAPFRIGILGKCVVGREIERAVEGKSIQGRRIVVSTYEGLHDGIGAQIVFIPSDYHVTDDDIASLHAAHKLTVGESRDFTRRGGVIRLYLTDNKVHFEINPKAAEMAGLELSSKLMRLARIVDDE